jgi:cytochrome c
MKRAHVVACLTLAAPLGALAQATDPAKLAQAKACTACHAIDKKVVGPAYKDVAAKYRGNKQATSLLVTKVLKGGAGAWGNIPMPPQPVTDAEAHQLVQWILQQK